MPLLGCRLWSGFTVPSQSRTVLSTTQFMPCLGFYRPVAFISLSLHILQALTPFNWQGIQQELDTLEGGDKQSHPNQLPGRNGNWFYASSSTLPSVHYRLLTWLSSWLAHMRRVSGSFFVELGEGGGREDRTESTLGTCLSIIIIIIMFLRAIVSDRLKRHSSFCWPWRCVSRILTVTAVHDVAAWGSHWFGAEKSICGSAELARRPQMSSWPSLSYSADIGRSLGAPES